MDGAKCQDLGFWIFLIMDNGQATLTGGADYMASQSSLGDATILALRSPG